MNITKYSVVLLFLMMLLMFCSRETDSNSLTEYSITNVELLLSLETTDHIAQPTRIRPFDGGFIFYDYGFKNIQVYNSAADHLYSFGNVGDGPGEYRDVAGLWVVNDEVILNDFRNARMNRYTKEGAFISQFEIPSNLLYYHQITLSQNLDMFIPVNGENNALVKRVSQQDKDDIYIGTALAEQATFFDMNHIRETILAGSVPDEFKNMVFLATDENHLYIFKQATGELEKYSMAGEFVWTTGVIEHPVMEKLFAHFIERNRSGAIGGVFPLSYISGMKAFNGGVLLTMTSLPDEPLLMLFINDSGKLEKSYTLDLGINAYPHQFSSDGKFLYLVDSDDGSVYRAEWPMVSNN
jgi:hypothetical protein